MSIPPDEIQIGNPEEWRRFVDANPLLVDEGPKLIDLAKKVFEKGYTGNNRSDLAIYSLGLMIFEDFEDIFILAANGRGFGAKKILRGMYERTCTLSYLARRPEEAQKFFDWEDIRAFKMSEELEKAQPGTISPEIMAERKADYDRARDEFMTTCDCQPDCQSQVEMFTWHNGSFASLAWKAKRGLGKDLMMSYSGTIIETHPTMMAAIGRMSHTPTGSTFADADNKSRQEARWVILMAYKYVLVACDIQIDHFPDLKQHAPFMKERADAYNSLEGTVTDETSGQHRS